MAVTSDERVLNACGGKREDLGSSRIRWSKYSQMERPMNGDNSKVDGWVVPAKEVMDAIHVVNEE